MLFRLPPCVDQTRRPFWASGAADEWDEQYNIGTSAGFEGTAPRYNPKHHIQALRLLLSAAENSPSLKKSRSLAVDVVDLTTTLMANEYIVLKMQLDVAASGVAPSAAAIEVIARKMAANILKTDQLLGSNGNFLLGKWVADAKSFGETVGERCVLPNVR